MFSFGMVFLLTIAPAAAEEHEKPNSSAEIVQAVVVRGTHRFVDLATQVGQPFNAETIRKDVRALWGTGRFADIQADAEHGPTGASVLFRLTEAPERRLRKVIIEPSSYGLHLALAEGDFISRPRAESAALDASRLLQRQGYPDAHVSFDLTPVENGRADLRLAVHPGDTRKVKRVEFLGDPGLPPHELQHSLHALRTRRILGWPLYPAYGSEAVESDLARIRSLYFSRGYFDANARVEEASAQSLAIRIEAGPRYDLSSNPLPACSCLLAARRAAEREGILDFGATLHVSTSGDTAGWSLDLQRGRAYRVGRIVFSGHHHFSDSAIRSNFVLNEGQRLDEQLLRRSVAPLNRTGLFEPIGENQVAIHADAASGAADIAIHLTERKKGGWRLSGPVGPASLAGPLEASISSRLPAWGAAMFELSTYAASISMFAFARPLLPALGISTKHPLLPVLALRRPFLPGDGWRSGFAIAPQLGWRAAGIVYGVTQLQERLGPVLSGDPRLESELIVPLEGPRGDGAILCDPPQPRLRAVRMTASLALRFLGAVASF